MGWMLLAVYPWIVAGGSPGQGLADRFPPPPGYAREAAREGSFGEWLRGLPLLPGRPPVLLHDGRRKANQEAHAAVVDIDVGRRDLQQCADAVMRLRAEYLFSVGRGGEVSFRATSGDPLPFARWERGERPLLSGRRLQWQAQAAPDGSHESFRRYLDVVFTYAGSQSLSDELAPVPLAELQAGDVLVRGGFPGHAVLVLDTARHPATGKRVFLLAQSYMPAQQIHVLRNPARGDGAWYELQPAGDVATPEWTFRPGELRRFGGI
jgi:hypothetical protein